MKEHQNVRETKTKDLLRLIFFLVFCQIGKKWGYFPWEKGPIKGPRDTLKNPCLHFMTHKSMSQGWVMSNQLYA